MRISEVGRQAGVSVTTLKYYLREGLLPDGVRTSATQSSYGPEHVRRARLVRVLTRTAGMSLGEVRELLQPLEESDPVAVMARAQDAVSGVSAVPHDVDGFDDVSTAAVDRVLADFFPSGKASKSPALAELRRLAALLVELGHPELLELFEVWASAATMVARAELASVAEVRVDPAQLAESVVVGTLLGQKVLEMLRILAQVELATSSSASEDHH